MNRRLTLIFLLIATFEIMTGIPADAGRDGRFGLSVKQPDSTLPQSSALPRLPQPKPKNPCRQNPLHPVGERCWELSEGWELADEETMMRNYGSIFSPDYITDSWTDAVVPGTVLTSLVEAGLYPDPYYGLDNLSIPDSLCRKEWWYRLSFDCPERAGSSKALLQFEGINYRADIWLNGHKLGKINGAFNPREFEVSSLLLPQNVIAVKIYPPDNPGIPHEQSAAAGQGHNGGVLCLDGPTFISSEGWDWIPGIRDRNIGIWQPVRLKYVDDVEIVSIQIIPDLPLPKRDYADLTLKATLKNLSDKPREICLSASLKGHDFSGEEVKDIVADNLLLSPNETVTLTYTPESAPKLRIHNPHLWWPNGYGEQYLYDCNFSVKDDRGVMDEKTERFGIREYSYAFDVADADNEIIRLHYQPTNDIHSTYPFDSSERIPAADGGVVVARLKDSAIALKRQVERSLQSPFLTIYCNGEKIFCRGGNWGMDDGMKRVSRERLEPALRFHKEQGFNMIRNWTGETTEEDFYALCDEYGMMVWNDFWLSTEGANLDVKDDDLFMENVTSTVKRFRNHPCIAIWCPRNEGYAPSDLDSRIKETVAREDGTRHYSPNSRYMNLRTSGPWHYLADPSEYFLHHAHGFSTELGSPCLPTAESMRKFIPESELWPISDTWHYHDLHDGLPHYCNAINSLYGESDSVDDFCRKAQMINYDSYRNMFEAWNSRMWDSTTGVLLWMSHPAWPSVEWQTYTWDLETTGAYFGAKKACEPVHIQMNYSDRKIIVINSTRKEYENLTVKVEGIKHDGSILLAETANLRTLPANGPSSTGLIIPDYLQGYLLRLTLSKGDEVISLNDFWLRQDNTLQYLNEFEEAKLQISDKRIDKDKKILLSLENISPVTAVGVKLTVRDKKTGVSLTPLFVSDGYINLIPGEKRELSIDFSTEKDYVIAAEGYNLPLQILRP